MSRRGAAFGKLVTLAAVLLVVGAIAIAAYANHKRHGSYTLHVFDPAWWTLGREEAQPYLDQARAAADTAYAKIWEDGGLVDQADRWLVEQKQRRAQPPAPAAPVATPAPPGAPAPAAPLPGDAVKPIPAPAPVAPIPPPVAKSPATARCEQRLAVADEHFQAGLVDYKLANPSDGGWTEVKKQAVVKARDRFALARDILEQTLGPYADLTDHDPAVLRDARDLQRINQRFFYNANKMSGGL